jgi:hypothetical protein
LKEKKRRKRGQIDFPKIIEDERKKVKKAIIASKLPPSTKCFFGVENEL